MNIDAAKVIKISSYGTKLFELLFKTCSYYYSAGNNPLSLRCTPDKTSNIEQFHFPTPELKNTGI